MHEMRRRLIVDGYVQVDGVQVKKAGHALETKTTIELRMPEAPPNSPSAETLPLDMLY